MVTFSQIPKLLAEFHTSIVGGHSGGLGTYKMLVGVVFWRGMKKDIYEFVKECQMFIVNVMHPLQLNVMRGDRDCS